MEQLNHQHDEANALECQECKPPTPGPAPGPARRPERDFKETGVTYALAAVGALGGVAKYYRPSPAALAWGAIVGYEVVAPKGELLSEGADRFIDKHPVVARLAIAMTALHLANVLPDQYDPFKRGLELIRPR